MPFASCLCYLPLSVIMVCSNWEKLRLFSLTDVSAEGGGGGMSIQGGEAYRTERR